MALSALQWKLIAARLVAKTDKEAAERCDIVAQTVADWKREDSEFAREYNAAFEDGVHVAKEIARQNLGQAAMTLTEGLKAMTSDGPDWKARLRAAELLLKSHGLLTDKVDANVALALSVTGDDLHEAVKRARQAGT